MSTPILPAKWAFTEHQQRFLEGKECLAGLHERNACEGKIVRAHIIPRSQLLQIATQGHVHAVPTRLLSLMQMQHHSTFVARDIGVGDFSVLNCFCTRHDNTLFAPLEDRPLVFSAEQLALLHYRAIAAEAYQRRNREDGASEVCRQYRSDDPKREPFYTIFWINSVAAQAAEDTLDHTERLITSSQYDGICALVVRFSAMPTLLSVGAFRPLYDLSGRKLQDFSEDSTYIAMHVLIADGKPALVFTWLREQKIAEDFVKSFASQPNARLTTLAIQTAFEYAEHTCMRRTWWEHLPETKRRALLKRVQDANSISVRTRKSLAFRTHYDDWNFDRLDFIHC